MFTREAMKKIIFIKITELVDRSRDIRNIGGCYYSRL